MLLGNGFDFYHWRGSLSCKGVFSQTHDPVIECSVVPFYFLQFTDTVWNCVPLILFKIMVSEVSVHHSNEGFLVTKVWWSEVAHVMVTRKQRKVMNTHLKTLLSPVRPHLLPFITLQFHVMNPSRDSFIRQVLHKLTVSGNSITGTLWRCALLISNPIPHLQQIDNEDKLSREA